MFLVLTICNSTEVWEVVRDTDLYLVHSKNGAVMQSEFYIKLR
jgi:hypothetical protein